MGKYKWHVERKEKETRQNKYGAKITRTFNHVTRLYNFILRNPSMFSRYTLQIYLHDNPMVEASFEDIQKRKDIGANERLERRFIIETKESYDKMLRNLKKENTHAK